MCDMKLTTLCYIERENAYLMLHRVSKEHDVNKDKWIGVGGHFEAGESPEECVLREVKEETGLTMLSWQFRGVITFSSEGWEDEYICLFTADRFSGELTACDEGVLEWVDREAVLKLNLWEGDKIFFRLLNEKRPFFSLKLSYTALPTSGWCGKMLPADGTSCCRNGAGTRIPTRAVTTSRRRGTSRRETIFFPPRSGNWRRSWASAPGLRTWSS